MSVKGKAPSFVWFDTSEYPSTAEGVADCLRASGIEPTEEMIGRCFGDLLRQSAQVVPFTTTRPSRVTAIWP